MKIIADGAWAQFLTSDGLPASNPPWGYISKLDLVSGKILWNVPVGDIDVGGKKIKIGQKSTKIITHESEIAEYGNRIIHFRDGRVVSDRLNTTQRDAAHEIKSIPEDSDSPDLKPSESSRTLTHL